MRIIVPRTPFLSVFLQLKLYADIHANTTFYSCVFASVLLTLHLPSAWRGVKRWKRPLPFLGAGGGVRRLHGTIDTHSQSDQRSRCLSNAQCPHQRESSASFRYGFFYARLISVWMCPGAVACLEQIFEICYKSMRGPIWCLVKEVGPGGSFIRARLNPYGSLIYHWSHLDVFEMRWLRNMTLLD